MSRTTVLLALLIAVNKVEADDQRLPVPMNACVLSLQDANRLSEEAEFFRYVWVPDGAEEKSARLDVALNFAVSRAGLPFKSHRVGGGVLRVDLRQLALKDKDLQELINNWEKLADDEPYFLVNAEQEVQILVVTGNEVLVRSEDETVRTLKKGHEEHYTSKIEFGGRWWYRLHDGYVLDEDVQVKASKKKARVLGVHCGIESLALHDLTLSRVPVVRYDYLIRKLLSTLEGGLYYEFRGIKESPDPKITDIDFFLREFAGVTEAEVAKLAQDPRNKVAMFESEVTHKPRGVVFFTGVQSRSTVNQGLVAITQDLLNDSLGPEQDPVRDLLNPAFDGTEVFVEWGNVIIYALFGGDLDGDGIFEVDGDKGEEGALVRVAPDQLVTDETVPGGHTTNLQPAISCMRCHSRTKDGKAHEGWIPVKNDIQESIKSGLFVFGSVEDGYPKRETIDKLLGMYQGRIEKPLTRARDDLAESMVRITGDVGNDKQSVTTKYHVGLSVDYNEYWYGTVTPQVACRELGFSVTEEDAALTLRRLLPPGPPNQFGFIQEDPYVGGLKRGASIKRRQWELIYPTVAFRAIDALLLEKANK